jgi:hypothetical protein
MWSRKRLLKKEHSAFARKRLLVISIGCGTVGVVLVVAGLFVQRGEPLFASPLPDITSGQKVDTTQNISKETKDLLKEKSIEFSSLSESKGKSFVITLKSGGEVIITDEKDLDEQLASLQRIVAQLTMEGKKLKRLDLRFDRPILVLQ